MTTADLTPTPPADTRQQAVQAALGLHIVWAFADGRLTCVGGRVNGHYEPCGWDGGNATPGNPGNSATHRAHQAERIAAALVSSSPALPEPPAPTPGPSSSSIWREGVPQRVQALPRYAEGPVILSGGALFTPAEARLLASTLLAAADVAEEGTR